MYVYGKGPSKTTVSATPGLGNAVTIQGMVTDQSPGAPDTPAISDANMNEWMDYLYMKQIMPTNAQGVPVTLYITDPNGATSILSTVTTDISGHYVVSWTPPTQGAYKITAAFDGTNSYASSTAVTGIAVGSGAAPAVSPTPTPSAPSPGAPSTVLWFVAIAAAIIIIVIIAVAVVLRRRK
jgi:subtilase family serine protease